MMKTYKQKKIPLSRAAWGHLYLWLKSDLCNKNISTREPCVHLPHLSGHLCSPVIMEHKGSQVPQVLQVQVGVVIIQHKRGWCSY